MNLIGLPIFCLGCFLVCWTLLSAIYTVVLPRGVRNRLTQFIFHGLGFRFFFPLARRINKYSTRDHLLALFAPISLLLLPLIWLALILVGFTCIFWALNGLSWHDALILSGSSLLTLGFSTPKTITATILAFLEAINGLVILSLQITYLPSIYSAFAKRETSVTRLDRRAGTPPSAARMFEYFNRIEDLEGFNEVWKEWEFWFAEVEESHTSFPFLVFFRSPSGSRSWLTATGAVLDSAALAISTVTQFDNNISQAKLVIRAGTIALKVIADVLEINHNQDFLLSDAPVCLLQSEYDEVYDWLQGLDLEVVSDREQGWRNFVKWRRQYDHVLITLNQQLMTPYAPWSSDRCLLYQDQIVKRKVKRYNTKKY